MKIIICDDEKIYADNISKNIRSFFSERNINVSIEIYYDSNFILESTVECDIAFLDIEMKPVNGIETARILKNKNPGTVIFFITAYSDYLDDAMDLDAFRYLSKPLNTNRLFDGLEKAINRIDITYKKFILEESGQKAVIKSSEIIMIEIVGKVTEVTTVNGIYRSKHNIAYWIENLNFSFFYQTHKSYLINSNYITDYSDDTVYLYKKYQVPISYRKRASFKKYILSFIERR